MPGDVGGRDEPCGERLVRRPRPERPGSGECLEQHEPQRVDVARGRGGEPLRLLGTQISRGADDGVGAGDARRPDEGGDSEIGQHRPGGLSRVGGRSRQDVGGLDVAVDDPPRVDDGESLCDLPTDARHLGSGQGTPRDAVGKGGARDQLHHEVRRRPAQTGVVQRDQGRVRQRRQQADLRTHPRDVLRIGSVAVDDLQCDRASEGGVDRLVHGRIATASDEAPEPVPAVEEPLGHGRRLLAHSRAPGCIPAGIRRGRRSRSAWWTA